MSYVDIPGIESRRSPRDLSCLLRQLLIESAYREAAPA
jgi:hypothetical protein